MCASAGFRIREAKRERGGGVGGGYACAGRGGDEEWMVWVEEGLGCWWIGRSEGGEEFGREGSGKEGREEFAKWIRRISRAALTMSRRN